MIRQFLSVRGILGLLLCAGVFSGGCSKKQETGGTDAAESPSQEMQLCNFVSGPEDAKVTVTAFYPGRHEDTLAAVKGLLEKYPENVRVEIVDWRTPEGMKRRDEAGLTCAGVVINDKNAFDIEIEGKKSKVLFVRGIDGEWTKADLFAAVAQELAAE